mgnify:CR=1 FL=1
MSVIEAVAIGSALLSIVILLVHHLALMIERQNLRCDVSRYELFRARDMLVWLVVSRNIAETDEVWAGLYGSVNSMLHVGHGMDEMRMILRYIDFVVQCSKDKNLKSEVESYIKKSEAVASRNHEFKKARDAVFAAMAKMVKIQTNPLHRFVVFGIYLTTRLLTVLLTVGLMPAIHAKNTIRLGVSRKINTGNMAYMERALV